MKIRTDFVTNSSSSSFVTFSLSNSLFCRYVMRNSDNSEESEYSLHEAYLDFEIDDSWLELTCCNEGIWDYLSDGLNIGMFCEYEYDEETDEEIETGETYYDYGYPEAAMEDLFQLVTHLTGFYGNEKFAKELLEADMYNQKEEENIDFYSVYEGSTD